MRFVTDFPGFEVANAFDVFTNGIMLVVVGMCYIWLIVMDIMSCCGCGWYQQQSGYFPITQQMPQQQQHSGFTTVATQHSQPMMAAHQPMMASIPLSYGTHTNTQNYRIPPSAPNSVSVQAPGSLVDHDKRV
eukprot:TRINITY_DN11170_c0_g1_i3.p1 TRINITY_DN11170_c0_g1~~TRINITY_DN11170_c0_g1_i3.p1  ORF type:complete len:132 (+),score=16.74 TRINITY_DN11170_c0_g1_i3:455-850(+)